VKKYRVFLILLVLLVSVSLFAQTAKDVVPSLSESQLADLLAGKLIKGASFSDDVMALVPEDTIAQKHLREALAKPDSFTVVSLSYVPYPEGMKDMSIAERQVAIFNTMRSISTQEGITYISHRAGNKPKVLFEKSWYLETPNSRKGLSDPVSSWVPPTDEYFVFQRDSSFGSNVYRHRYTTSDDEIFVEVKNLETMRVFSIFKAVEEEMLAIAMSTKQLDEGLLLSAMATIEGREPEVRILGISVDLPSAFTRRTTALGEWFVDQLYR
jgi:hypothetical protein